MKSHHGTIERRRRPAFGSSAGAWIFLVLLLSSLAGCWDDGPVPFEEPLEILIGSTELGGGALTTEFDTGQIVGVVFSTEIGGISIYSDTDPGFVSLGSRVVTGPPFGLPAGIPIGIRVTEIDPEVQVILGGALLSRPGDAATIGGAPVHVHPIWQLTVPTGTPPRPYFVSFVLTADAAEYADSQEITLTIAISEDGVAGEAGEATSLAQPASEGTPDLAPTVG